MEASRLAQIQDPAACRALLEAPERCMKASELFKRSQWQERPDASPVDAPLTAVTP